VGTQRENHGADQTHADRAAHALSPQPRSGAGTDGVPSERSVGRGGLVLRLLQLRSHRMVPPPIILPAAKDPESSVVGTPTPGVVDEPARTTFSRPATG